MVKKYRCRRCGQTFRKDDPTVEIAKERHTLGRHTRHITQNERYSSTLDKNPNKPKEINGGLGGLDYGPVEWDEVDE